MSSKQRKSIRIALSKSFSPEEVNLIETEINLWCEKLALDGKTTYELSYTKYSYEAVGILIQHPNLKEELLNDMKKGKSGWDLSAFDYLKPKKYEPVIKDKETSYVYFCKNKRCGGGCSIVLQQTRSADEGMTQFAICGKCADRYRVNY